MGDGYLRSPHLAMNRVAARIAYMMTGEPAYPKWHGGAWSARCDRGHRPPSDDCRCGVRGVTDLRELLTYSGTTGTSWLDEHHVIGQVELSGRITSPPDPEDNVQQNSGGSSRVATALRAATSGGAGQPVQFTLMYW